MGGWGPVHRLVEVDSTSDVARQLARDGAPEGTLVVADRQLAGRGRHGRDWYSPPGAGLYMSLVLRPRLESGQLPRLTVVAAVAVVQALQGLTGIAARIKWPNDIWVGERKLGGLLAESFAGGVVLGVGINVGPCHFPPQLVARATCLDQQLGGHGPGVEAVRLAVLERFRALYGCRGSCLDRAGDWARLLELYRSRCLTLGRGVRFVDGRRPESGLAVAVDGDGNLVVEAPDGGLHTVRAGDVELEPGAG